MAFVHMIQMPYYVKDPLATVSFFRSLLHKDGKLLIMVSGDIKTFLDPEGIPYQSYELLSQMDITECFTEGDQEGELLLDFLTKVIEFRKNAPEDLKKGVLDLPRHPDCSKEVDGRIIFNNNLSGGAIVPRLLSISSAHKYTMVLNLFESKAPRYPFLNNIERPHDF